MYNMYLQNQLNIILVCLQTVNKLFKLKSIEWLDI